MPTQYRRDALTSDAAAAVAGETAFPRPIGVPRPDGVGLEPEYFPIFVDRRCRPAARVPLRTSTGNGVLEVLDGLAGGDSPLEPRSGGELGPWHYGLSSSGRLTFEPGGQVEHSTAVYPTAGAAIADCQRVLDGLRRCLAPRGIALAAAGLDIWHAVDSVSQQLPFGRYTAQAAYYELRGRWGRVMMRHTASLQINLDLGAEGVWQERWLAAQLISPLITASFACSPNYESVSTRAEAWQELDPTRSGFPASLVDGSEDDPRRQWASAALAADVMLFRLDDGRWRQGEPGFRFARWIRDGHPEIGWPTSADFSYHLTTLFFEVRPRGFLELRAGEGVPDEVRPAEVALPTAVLYDDRARSRVLELLAPCRPELPRLWRRAARAGVGDDGLADLAVRTWEEALRGAERLRFDAETLAAARSFVERFTMRGRSPADELRRLDLDDPAASLAWAASLEGGTGGPRP